ncbi:MAG: nitroreductase [Gammaproteobacteria bacterium]
MPADHLPALAAELIRTRRTIEEFKPEPAPREALVKALDLARWAPNHRLTEPWRFYLLGRDTAQAIARLNAELVTNKNGPAAGRQKLERWLAMPGWLVVTCNRSDDALQAREDYAACCCAVQNFMLYLWSAGIGVKWTTGAVTRDPRFYDLIWVDPAAEEVVGLFWYGYPATIPQTPRKPLSEVMVELP